MQIVRIAITGTSAVLMNNAACMNSGDTSGELQRGGKKIPAPYDEAKVRLYVMPTGQLFIPPDCFREAACIAAADCQDKTRKGRANMKRRFGSSVYLCTEHCPLFRASTGEPITEADEDWEIDRRRVVIQRQGVIRSRPKISDWCCTLEFEYDEKTITPHDIVGIVQYSGKYPGVLDYRPSQRGPFGRFTAEPVDNDGVVMEQKQLVAPKSVRAKVLEDA